ncbi:MAG: hypothetical protein ACI9F9_000576 [Candidatus Paceibacteria bacterium]|jgi:hypothetical protein
MEATFSKHSADLTAPEGLVRLFTEGIFAARGLRGRSRPPFAFWSTLRPVRVTNPLSLPRLLELRWEKHA